MTKLAIFRATQKRANSKSILAPRARPLVCVWTRDRANNRLTCRWRRAEAEPETSDRPCPRRDRRRPLPAAPAPLRTTRSAQLKIVGARR
jgi:hypothetical protein